MKRLVKPLRRKRKAIKKKAIVPIELPNRKVIALHGVQADCVVCKEQKRFGKLISGVGFICETCYDTSKALKEK